MCKFGARAELLEMTAERLSPDITFSLLVGLYRSNADHI